MNGGRVGVWGREKYIDVLQMHEVKNEKPANENITPPTHTHAHANPEAVDSAVFHSLWL